MRIRSIIVGTTTAIMLSGFSSLIASPDSTTYSKSDSSVPASELIGKKVRNAQDEDLGKIQDVVINLESGAAPYAIIAHGGAFGAGRTKTVVPLQMLQCSGDRKTLILPATKEQLRAASTTPTGHWVGIKDAEWTKNIDGYYGEPGAPLNKVRTDRTYSADASTLPSGDRVYVREGGPAPKGGELLLQSDRALYDKVCQSIDAVRVEVENGVARLYGRVESEAARDRLESRVKAVPGVQKVEDHLTVRNP